MKNNKLLFKVLILILAITGALFAFKKLPWKQKTKDNDYTHLTMQSWLNQDWSKAIPLSHTLKNSLFRSAIMSDYLLHYQGHTDYLNLLQTFIAQNPFWPKNAVLIKNAEKYLNQYPSNKVLAWAQKYPMQTAQGKKYYLYALKKCNLDKTNSLVKNIWHKDRTFNAQEEQEFFNEYKNYLTYEDHLIRINTLLWHRQIKDSYFLNSFLNNQDKKAVQCRVLLQKKDNKGTKVYEKIKKNIHPILINGIAYDLLRFYKDAKLNKQKRGSIIQDLIKLPAETKYVNKWTNLKICYAREMLLLGDYNLAYSLLAANHAKPSSTPYLKAHHLAGFILLTKLKNPDLALRHFNLVRKYATYPSETSRNYYFLYLCTKHNKDLKEISKNYLEQASKYIATFYGQIANSTLNKTINFAVEGKTSDEDFKKVQDLIEFIKILAKYKKYQLADLLLTKTVSILTKKEIAEVTSIVGEASNDQNWKMMVANTALNKNVVLPNKLFPIIKLPASIEPSNSDLIHAIIRKESVFDFNAVSSKNAIGLMQLTSISAKLCSHKMKNSKSCHLNPESNIILGNYYINTFFKTIYNQNLILSIAAYHAGRENVRRWISLLEPIKGKDNILTSIQWIESIPFFSTQQYIQTVIRNKNMYFAMKNNGKLCIKDDLH